EKGMMRRRLPGARMDVQGPAREGLVGAGAPDLEVLAHLALAGSRYRELVAYHAGGARRRRAGQARTHHECSPELHAVLGAQLAWPVGGGPRALSSRQTEDALRDDVALHLAGPARDRHRAVVEVLPGPAAIRRRVLVPHERRVRAEDLHRRLGVLLHEARAHELHG